MDDQRKKTALLKRLMQSSYPVCCPAGVDPREFAKKQNPIKRKIAKYRWEFMRRTDEYRKDYQKIQSLRAAAEKEGAYVGSIQVGKKGWKDLISRTYAMTRQFEEEAGIRSKYELAVMIDPGKRWDELNPHEKFHLKRDLSGVRLNESLHEPGKVKIEIDFRRIRNISLLKKVLSEEIDFYLYRDIGRKRLDLKEFPCLNLLEKDCRSDNGNSDFDKVLEAGDLEAAGVRPIEIARRLFPSAFRSKAYNAKDQMEAARTNTARLRAEYHRMVAGGYRELSFP